MFLSIKEMERRTLPFDQTWQPGLIDFSGENLEMTAPLHAVGSAEVTEDSNGEVHIQAKYSGELGAQCDRCLGPARFPLDDSFDLFYHPVSEIEREEEVEIDEDEAELGFYKGDGLELEDVLREQILLALPMQHVCSEDCKGICPICGGNRNETACGCKADDEGGHWRALRDITPSRRG